VIEKHPPNANHGVQSSIAQLESDPAATYGAAVALCAVMTLAPALRAIAVNPARAVRVE
jgi:ABC-type lipoprotein release transport system permease subunit